MFTTAVLLAHKFEKDAQIRNEEWAGVVGMTVEEVMRVEMEFLGLVGFELFVKEEVFEGAVGRLVGGGAIVV